MSNIYNKLIIVLAILAFIIIAFFAFTPISTKAAYDEELFYDTELFSGHRSTTENDIQEPKNPKPSITSLKPSSIDGIKEKVTIDITGSGFTPDSIVRKNNINYRSTFIDAHHLLVDVYASDMRNSDGFYLSVFNQEPGGGYSNASFFTIKNKTTTSTTTSNTKTTYYPSTSSSNSTSKSTSNTNNTSVSNVSRTNETFDNSAASDVNESYGSLTANALLGSNSVMPSGLLQWIFLIIIVLAIIFLWRYLHRSEEKYLSSPLKHA